MWCGGCIPGAPAPTVLTLPVLCPSGWAERFIANGGGLADRLSQKPVTRHKEKQQSPSNCCG